MDFGTIDRPAYETPILLAELKSKLIQDINNSGLMFCEIESVISDIHWQIQANTREELQSALSQKEKLQNNQEKNIDEKNPEK